MTFDNDGKADFNLGEDEVCTGMKLVGNRIYFSGYTDLNGDNDFALLALKSDGSPLITGISEIKKTTAKAGSKSFDRNHNNRIKPQRKSTPANHKRFRIAREASSLLFCCISVGPTWVLAGFYVGFSWVSLGKTQARPTFDPLQTQLRPGSDPGLTCWNCRQLANCCSTESDGSEVEKFCNISHFLGNNKISLFLGNRITRLVFIRGFLPLSFRRESISQIGNDHKNKVLFLMTVQFDNAYLEKLYQGKAVKGKPKYSSDVITKFKKTILKLKYADSISDLKCQKGLNFESLKGEYKGFYSVRVDYSYRLILALENDRLAIADIITVHDLTNHYQ